MNVKLISNEMNGNDGNVSNDLTGKEVSMGHRIDDETIEYVGILAKLSLTGQEKEKAKADMEKMLDYIDTLNELDTQGIEPMSHVFPVNNVFRDDVISNGDGSEETLANAPLRKNNEFEVPKTIG
jgi:aspartyl-tRNA(Asn)/glutamyl-tRNA(Gln) amidotransferase subunit C